MTWLWLILVVVILGVTTAVAAGRGDRLRPAYPDRPDVRLPAARMVGAQDLAGLRLSVALRGYRMDEVDDLIGRLTREIALRDAELARLSGERESTEHGHRSDTGHPDDEQRESQSEHGPAAAGERRRSTGSDPSGQASGDTASAGEGADGPGGQA